MARVSTSIFKLKITSAVFLATFFSFISSGVYGYYNQESNTNNTNNNLAPATKPVGGGSFTAAAAGLELLSKLANSGEKIAALILGLNSFPGSNYPAPTVIGYLIKNSDKYISSLVDNESLASLSSLGLNTKSLISASGGDDPGLASSIINNPAYKLVMSLGGLPFGGFSLTLIQGIPVVGPIVASAGNVASGTTVVDLFFKTLNLPITGLIGGAVPGAGSLVGSLNNIGADSTKQSLNSLGSVFPSFKPYADSLTGDILTVFHRSFNPLAPVFSSTQSGDSIGSSLSLNHSGSFAKTAGIYGSGKDIFSALASLDVGESLTPFSSSLASGGASSLASVASSGTLGNPASGTFGSGSLTPLASFVAASGIPIANIALASVNSLGAGDSNSFNGSDSLDSISSSLKSLSSFDSDSNPKIETETPKPIKPTQIKPATELNKPAKPKKPASTESVKPTAKAQTSADKTVR